VREGYGALIAACGAGLPVRLETEVREIDHSGACICVRTARGAIEARAVVIAVPTTMLAALRLAPDLPDKRAAAAALPLGCAEKLYFALAHDGRLFARTDCADTGAYHLRPLGRPLIEAYFGGALARRLAAAGAAAMADFAKQELAGVLGARFPSRLALLASSSWSSDPFARGAYSYAAPGQADARAELAAAHEGRLFFAGEGCSRSRYSTVHGAFETGLDAAEQALAALGQAGPSPRA
jgi:monoamine oxidase